MNLPTHHNCRCLDAPVFRNVFVIGPPKPHGGLAALPPPPGAEPQTNLIKQVASTLLREERQRDAVLSFIRGRRTCRRCKGEGFIVVAVNDRRPVAYEDVVAACPDCQGRG